MQAHDLNAPDLDTVREPHGRSRLFLDTIASAVFVFLFVVLVGTGAVLMYHGATSKPTVPPEGFAELQQQLKSIAVDLAAVRQVLEQQSAANHDQLTRIQ